MEKSSPTKTKYIKSKKYTGISHRVTDTDTIYYCSYKTKAGNYSRFKCGYKSAGYSEKMAYEFMQREKQKVLGTNIETISKDISVLEAAKNYTDFLTLKKASDHINTKRKIFKHLIPAFGHYKISELTGIKVYEYIRLKESEGYATATYRMHVSLLSSIINHSIRKSKKYSGENVVRGIEQSIHVDNFRETVFTISQVSEILDILHTNRYKKRDNIKYFLELFFKLSISLGSRAGDTLRLKAGDFNFDENTVKIFNSKGREFYTGVVNRKLINNIDVEFIQTHKSHHYIFWSRDRQVSHKVISYNLRDIFYDMFNKKFTLDLEAGHITPQEFRKLYVSLHSCRHFFISRLISLGYSTILTAKLSGHKDLKQLMRYSKISPDARQEAVQAIF